MIEALWSIEFQSNLGLLGSGVAVFETGRVLGGDSAFMYAGSYEISNGIINSKIKVTKYSDTSNMQSVMGQLNVFNLNLSGNVDASSIVLTGNMVENQDIQIT